ncbi:MAG: hypothetical protein IPG89_20730 [Bacteroidetes bacterium]|nr:hypothetical protein [Bacteroidota bacterium]
MKRIEGQGNGGTALELTQSSINSILASPDHRAVELEYENLQGPIQVRVIDPLKVLSGTFVVKVKSDSLLMGSTSELDSGKVRSDYKYQVEGTYVNSSGATVSKTWNADEILSIGQEQILIELMMNLLVFH